MSESDLARIARIRRWLDRLQPLALASHPLGKLARQQLPHTTGLSAASVEWALTQAFEIHATDQDIRALVAGVAEAPVAHVLLSANVFVGALRAIALALASSKTVRVRPSRREPVTAAILHRAAPDAFELVSVLRPESGDHVWAYGTDTTLARLKSELPSGVVLHSHGSGFGVFLVDASTRPTAADFDAMALDIAAFEQRGCLSPRFALLEGDRRRGAAFASQLLEAMTRIEEQLPIGTVDPLASTQAARHREIWRYLGDVYQGPGGTITVDSDRNAWGVPPSNRTLHVRVVDDALADLSGQSAAITAVGSARDPSLSGRILSRAPRVRWSPFGFMQRPRLDGPADRRTDPAGIIV